MTEALRMLDVRKDIPETLVAKKPAKEKPGEFASDLAIADLGEPSIMDEDATVKQLLAEQLKPAADPDEIPAPKPIAPQVTPPPALPLLALAGKPEIPAAQNAPMVPDFRGKSMRDVVEESSAKVWM